MPIRLAFLSALVAASTLALPSAAQAFGCEPNCPPPTISADSASTTVDEGSQATMTGSYSGRAPVTVSASVGSVSASTGSWTWHWTPGDGPGDSRTVTMTVDSNDGTETTTFDVTVQNVAPSASGLNAPSNATSGTPFTVSVTGATDPSATDGTSLQYAFDCGTGTFGSFGSSSSGSCTFGGEGFRTVRGEVKDKDGSISGAYSSVVGVFSPVTVTEGTTASKSFAGVGMVCAASANVGSAIVSSGNALSWSIPTNDGPGQSTNPVSINVELPISGVCLGSTFDPHRTIQFPLTVNNAPPTATFNSPSVVAAGTAIPISLSGPTDPSAPDRTGGYRYSFDCGSGFGALSTTATASCPGAASGPVSVKGRVYDKDDGFTEYTASVPVDGSGPDTTIQTKPTAIDTDPTPSFSWTGSDPGGSVASYAYKIDGGPWSAFGPDTGVTLPALADGQHTFQVKAKDAAGNEDASPAVYTWAIGTSILPSPPGPAPTQATPETQTATQTPSSQSHGGTIAVPGCKVPNLKKKTLAAAKKALAKAHCKLGKIKKKRVKRPKHGRVTSQSVRAGATKPAGTKVNLVLAR